MTRSTELDGSAARTARPFPTCNSPSCVVSVLRGSASRRVSCAGPNGTTAALPRCTRSSLRLREVLTESIFEQVGHVSPLARRCNLQLCPEVVRDLERRRNSLVLGRGALLHENYSLIALQHYVRLEVRTLEARPRRSDRQ